jgi:uncharacterized protein
MIAQVSHRGSATKNPQFGHHHAPYIVARLIGFTGAVFAVRHCLAFPFAECASLRHFSVSQQCARGSARFQALRTASAAALTVIVFVGAAVAGPFEDADEAYQRGDHAVAMRLYHPLAEEGYAHAQYTLGLMYHNGQGVPQDHAEALKWLRKAADQEYAKAQDGLGFIYQGGDGVPQDYAEALKWFRRAADQGMADAQYNLGFMYQNGQGVPQDYAEALKWWRKAANQGMAKAQLALGAMMYFAGRGVPKDIVRAHMWVNLAASRDYPDAQKARKLRDTIAQRMTPVQIAEAQKLAREWKPTRTFR